MSDVNNTLKNARLPLVSGLLATLALVLFCMQYTTVYKLSVLKPSASHLTLHNFLVALPENQIELDLLDSIWFFLLTVTLVSMLVLEWRYNSLTLYSSNMLSTNRRAILFFSACSLVLVRYYFAPGEPSWAGDAPQHINYAEITRQILSQGELPIWTNALGAGSPYLQFYGFLFFYLSATVAIIVNDFFTGLKITLALCHILSGLGVYALISYKTVSRRAGFFAGLVYVLCFWHVQQVLVMGRLPLSLFYALLPWPFYFFERALSTAHIRNILSGALALSLLAFTHPGYGFWASIFFAIYAMLRVCTRHASQRRRGLLIGSSTLVLGLIAGAYLTLAMWIEKDSTGLSEGFHLNAPGPSWWHLLVWSNFRFWLLPPSEPFHWYGGYLGISAVVTALVGVFCSISWRRRKTIAVWLPFLLCGMIIWGHDTSPLNQISVVQALPAGRYLLFIVFFLSLAAGLGFHSIAVWSRKVGKKHVPTIVLLFLLLDLGPTTFQHIYTNKAASQDLRDFVLNQVSKPPSTVSREVDQIPNFRLLWTAGSQNPYLIINRTQFTTQIPDPRTIHPGDLRSGRKFSNIFERLANHILIRKKDGDRFSGEEIHFLNGGLRMLNVGILVSTTSDDGTFTSNISPNPILTSNRLTPYPTENSKDYTRRYSRLDQEFRTFLTQLDTRDIVDYESVIQIIENTESLNHCAQIFVRGLDQKRQLLTQADVTLHQHTVSHSRVNIHFTASDPTFIRLAYSYYPHFSVRLNGKEIKPYETAGHFIALQVPKGTHHVELVAELSPLRRWLLGIHIGLWLLTAVAWIRKI